jgi:hypothetical protein
MDFKWETAKPAQPKGSYMDSEDGIIFLFYAVTGVILTPTSCYKQLLPFVLVIKKERS